MTVKKIVNGSTDKIKNNPKILAVPLIFNLLLYAYFHFVGFSLTGSFNFSLTLPSIPPEITQVVEVKLPRFQEMALEMLNLSPSLTYEQFLEALSLENIIYITAFIAAFSLLRSFIQGGFLGLIKNDFGGYKASFNGFLHNGRYFLIRLFLTQMLYFLLITVFIVLLVGVVATSDPMFALRGGLFFALGITVLALLIIVLLLVFHEYAIVENDTGVLDGIRRSYITVKTNVVETLKYLLVVAVIMLIGGAITQLVAGISLVLAIVIFVPVGTVGIYIIYELYRYLNRLVKTKAALGEDNYISGEQA